MVSSVFLDSLKLSFNTKCVFKDSYQLQLNCRGLYNKAKVKDLLTLTLVKKQILTGFLCADGELLTGLALANRIVGVHANAVDGGRVKVHYVGLIVGGGDVSSGVFQLPGV